MVILTRKYNWSSFFILPLFFSKSCFLLSSFRFCFVIFQHPVFSAMLFFLLCLSYSFIFYTSLYFVLELCLLVFFSIYLLDVLCHKYTFKLVILRVKSTYIEGLWIVFEMHVVELEIGRVRVCVRAFSFFLRCAYVWCTSFKYIILMIIFFSNLCLIIVSGLLLVS